MNDSTIAKAATYVAAFALLVAGTASNDFTQPYVTIVISGTVSSGPRKTPQVFAIQTGATMRGIDLTITRAPSIILPKPTCTLEADPTIPILQGGLAKLTWTTENADKFSIDKEAPLTSPAAGGSVSVAPSVTTTYTGTAVGGGGSDICSVRVEVTIAVTTPP